MSEKIYCKDCRFRGNRTCRRMPPALVFYGKGVATRYPEVDPDDWCGMAERKEEAGAEFVTVGNVEADDAVYFTSYREIGKLKAENKNLRRLIAEVGEFLVAGALPGRVHLKHEEIQAIYVITSEVRKERAGR